MDRYLKVQLNLSRDCKLNAIDFSDYNSIGEDINNHVMLDFLVYKDNKEPIENSIKLRHESLNWGYLRQKFETEYILTKDGTYTYYKFVIPTIHHFWNGTNLINNISDELFYYKGNIYWFKSTCEIYSNITLDNLLQQCSIVESYLEIYDIVFNNHATQTFYLPAKKIFSICKLNKCLVSLQKQLLFNTSCKDDKKKERDFLFVSLYIFDYLKDLGNFAEAQRILDNLSECEYCQNELNNSECCCGSN